MTTETAAPPFSIGQTVYVADANAYGETRIPCPICFGKLRVTLILGNGEHQAVTCEACDFGMQGPRGEVRHYKAASSVTPWTVTGINQTDGGWQIMAGGSAYKMADGNIFATREEAEARRLVLHAEAEEQARAAFDCQMVRAAKSHTWTAAYSRSAIARLKRDMEWHERKLCAEKLP
jgi:hypothetical protein